MDDASIAIYDLARHPTTFDFAPWSVIAKAHGARHVQFGFDGRIAAWKYPEYIAWRRFGNILVPLTLLSGMTFAVGKSSMGKEYPYLIGDVEKTYKKLGKIGKLKSVIETKKRGYVTVTLRESFRGKYRNSNMEAWTKFVEYVEKRGKQVVVFPECETAPIDLLHRMAMYASADMNLGVNGGPMTLCLYSDAPYIMLNMCPKNDTDEKTYDMEKLLRSCDFWEKNFSFRSDKQLIVWGPDTFENIVSAYESLMDEKPKVVVDERVA